MGTKKKARKNPARTKAAGRRKRVTTYPGVTGAAPTSQAAVSGTPTAPAASEPASPVCYLHEFKDW